MSKHPWHWYDTLLVRVFHWTVTNKAHSRLLELAGSTNVERSCTDIGRLVDVPTYFLSRWQGLAFKNVKNNTWALWEPGLGRHFSKRRFILTFSFEPLLDVSLLISMVRGVVRSTLLPVQKDLVFFCFSLCTCRSKSTLTLQYKWEFSSLYDI